MKKKDRLNLLLEKINELKFVDILNADFVDWYIQETKTNYKMTKIGANISKTLSSDLVTLYKMGKLKRDRVSIYSMACYGFPKWVYSYSLSN